MPYTLVELKKLRLKDGKDNSGDKIYVKRQTITTLAADDQNDGFQSVTCEPTDFLSKYGSIKEATIYEFQLQGKKARMNLQRSEKSGWRNRICTR